MRVTALAAGAALAGAAFVGTAPVARPAGPGTLPVVHVGDIALASSAFDPVALQAAFIQVLQELAKITGYGQRTVSEAFFPGGLGGSLTPNELLNFTGLGNATLGDLNQFAGLFGLNQDPLGVLMAAAGVTDNTTLSSEIDKLGIGGAPLSDFYNLIGLTDYQTATLGDLATALGIGNDSVSQLFGVLGLSDTSTLDQAAAAFGIGGTQVDTLLGDWGVGPQDIGTFLQGLSVTPQELFADLGIDPSTLPAGIWDAATDTFAPDATVQQFADATGFGHDTVTQLLSTNDLGGASLDEALTGIGLQDSASVNQVLDTVGFNDLKIWDFLNGFGVYSSPTDQTATLNEFFTAIPGLQHTTFGGLLGGLGLSDQSTIADVYAQIPALGDNTLSSVVGDFGVGDDHLSDLANTLLGSTTLSEWLADIQAALTAA
ncbi:MAG TPA: hypothetical protein VFR17_07070 [Mycobacterium sp.]|nr:hypothetical protein [Mycobacterium sp.]